MNFTSHRSTAYLSRNSTSRLFLSGGKAGTLLPVQGSPLQYTKCKNKSNHNSSVSCTQGSMKAYDV